MSLPIYEAVSFQGMLAGGRTNPWLVIVNENGQETPYVVKLFSQGENDRNESIVNEVIGNVLATEFSLLTPQPALIDIDNPSFISSINDVNAFRLYEHSDERIKFGCKYVNPSFQYIRGAFTRAQMKKSIEIDVLFAFDNLIINRDRGQNRSNLLLKDRDAYLIDHELAFSEINGGTMHDINNKNWFRGYEHHIFYEYLKKSSKKVKLTYFVEFEEYLKYLDVNKLRPYLEQLNNYDYVTNKHDYILQYLETVRNNSRNFVQLLQALIT